MRRSQSGPLRGPPATPKILGQLELWSIGSRHWWGCRQCRSIGKLGCCRIGPKHSRRGLWLWHSPSMRLEMGTAGLPISTPSSVGWTPIRPWLTHPSAGLCLPRCRNQSHLEQHLLMVVSLIGRRENCSIGNLQLACIETIILLREKGKRNKNFIYLIWLTYIKNWVKIGDISFNLVKYINLLIL